MDDWWNSLGTELRVFYAIATAGTTVLVAQLALQVFGIGDGDADGADGMDGDVGADMDTDMDGDGDAHATGLNVLSIRSITAFIAGFGWAGVIAPDHDGLARVTRHSLGFFRKNNRSVKSFGMAPA